MKRLLMTLFSGGNTSKHFPAKFLFRLKLQGFTNIKKGVNPLNLSKAFEFVDFKI